MLRFGTAPTFVSQIFLELIPVFPQIMQQARDARIFTGTEGIRELGGEIGHIPQMVLQQLPFGLRQSFAVFVLGGMGVKFHAVRRVRIAVPGGGGSQTWRRFCGDHGVDDKGATRSTAVLPFGKVLPGWFGLPSVGRRLLAQELTGGTWHQHAGPAPGRGQGGSRRSGLRAEEGSYCFFRLSICAATSLAGMSA